MISRLLPRTRDDCCCPTVQRSEYVVLLRMRPPASLSDTHPSLLPIVLVVVAVAPLSSTFDFFIAVVVACRTILE
jgi:hypothetical protein